MIKYSVIIPVYKVEEYLEKCVESVRNQTYKNIEIVLVDDGSPDNCPQMCDELAQKDSRIKVIHKENGGLSDARNKGLELSTGDYVIFLDSDDYIDVDSCERFLQYAENGCDIIIGEAVVEGGKCNSQHISNPNMMTGEQYLLEAYRGGKAPMAACFNIYKREFLINNSLCFKKGILHEDEEFTPRCFLLAETVVCPNVYFYHYIIRNDSITTKKDKRKNASDFYNTCLTLKEIYAKLENQELKNYLIDSLSSKYLTVFQSGKLYIYGKDYLHRRFVLQNAKQLKTRLKAFLYFVSPKCYYHINECLSNHIKEHN